MRDFQVVYGFCLFFVAATMMVVAYWDGFADIEFDFEPEEYEDDKKY